MVRKIGLEPTLADWCALRSDRSIRCSTLFELLTAYLNLVYILYHIRLSLSSVFEKFFEIFLDFYLLISYSIINEFCEFICFTCVVVK